MAFGMATLLLLVEEEQRALLPTFEIAAADEAGDGRVKRRPFRAGTTIAPYHPSAPLLPSPPHLPNRSEGEPGTMLNHRVGQLTIPNLTSARVRFLDADPF
jgi:hypothetical protein